MNGPSDKQTHLRLALEQIALDSVGALSSDQTETWVREHLDAGCEICTDASARVADLFEGLLLAAEPVKPPPDLRQRVLAAVRDGSTKRATRDEATLESPTNDAIQVWNRWKATGTPKFHTLPASNDDWQETAVPGVTVRPLHVDENEETVTMLVRMSAGTAYPRHRHASDEQCYVLEGDLHVEDQKLTVGDYQFAPEGSIHGVQSTKNGCLLLILSSQHDELLAD